MIDPIDVCIVKIYVYFIQITIILFIFNFLSYFVHLIKLIIGILIMGTFYYFYKKRYINRPVSCIHIDYLDLCQIGRVDFPSIVYENLRKKIIYTNQCNHDLQHICKNCINRFKNEYKFIEIMQLLKKANILLIEDNYFDKLLDDSNYTCKVCNKKTIIEINGPNGFCYDCFYMYHLLLRDKLHNKLRDNDNHNDYGKIKLTNKNYHYLQRCFDKSF